MSETLSRSQKAQGKMLALWPHSECIEETQPINNGSLLFEFIAPTPAKGDPHLQHVDSVLPSQQATFSLEKGFRRVQNSLFHAVFE